MASRPESDFARQFRNWKEFVNVKILTVQRPFPRLGCCNLQVEVVFLVASLVPSNSILVDSRVGCTYICHCRRFDAAGREEPLPRRFAWNPWSEPTRFWYARNPRVPIPTPVKTRTHEHGYGFQAGVGAGTHRVTHGLPVTGPNCRKSWCHLSRRWARVCHQQTHTLNRDALVQR